VISIDTHEEQRLTEDSTRRIITGETGLAHTGAVHMSVSWPKVNCPGVEHLRRLREVASALQPLLCETTSATYPLSMTRAATSSVHRTHVSLSFVADHAAHVLRDPSQVEWW
jgi:hypothetical protein